MTTIREESIIVLKNHTIIVGLDRCLVTIREQMKITQRIIQTEIFTITLRNDRQTSEYKEEAQGNLSESILHHGTQLNPNMK